MKNVINNLLLLVPGTVWGTSFIVVELVLPVVPPITLTFIRSVISVISLLLLMRLVGSRLPKNWSEWWPFIIVGSINQAIPFALTSWGQVYIEGGLASILLSVMPLFTILLAYWLISDEQLNIFKLVGIISGFIGIIILVGPSALQGIEKNVIAQLAVIGAALLYAAGAVYIRFLYPQQPKDLSAQATALRITTAQFVVSAILLLPFSLWLEAPWAIRPTAETWFYLLFLGIGTTLFATVIYHYLINELGASVAATTIYLIPVAGVILGAIVLGEEITLQMLVALSLILFGIFVVNQGENLMNLFQKGIGGSSV